MKAGTNIGRANRRVKVIDQISSLRLVFVLEFSFGLPLNQSNQRFWLSHLIRRTDSLEKTLMLAKAGGEGDDRGWDGWMASLTQWTWVGVSSRSWGWTGRPGVLQSMGLQRVGHDWATELNWNEAWCTWLCSTLHGTCTWKIFHLGSYLSALKFKSHWTRWLLRLFSALEFCVSNPACLLQYL